MQSYTYQSYNTTQFSQFQSLSEFQKLTPIEKTKNKPQNLPCPNGYAAEHVCACTKSFQVCFAALVVLSELLPARNCEVDVSVRLRSSFRSYLALKVEAKTLV